MIRAYYTNTFLRQTRHCRLKLFETPLDNKGKLAFLAPQASLFLPYLFATFGLGHFATCHGIFKAVRPFGHQLYQCTVHLTSINTFKNHFNIGRVKKGLIAN